MKPLSNYPETVSRAIIIVSCGCVMAGGYVVWYLWLQFSVLNIFTKVTIGYRLLGTVVVLVLPILESLSLS